MRKLPIYLALLAALAVVVELLWHAPLRQGGEAPPLTSRVLAVDALTGSVLDGVRVTRLDAAGADLGQPLAPDRRGFVDVEVANPRLVRLAADGYLPRVVALSRSPETGEPLVHTVPLTPDTAGVSLRVGGRVMAGRGLFLPGYAGRASDAVLQPSATDLAGHAALLSAVAPMLGDADVTLVTLGTPLVDEPHVRGPRPAGYHPQRQSVLSASTALAGALADAGVDVVNLADSHLYDALDSGLASTLESLDAAGLAHFGAGATVEEAWAPAFVESRGRTIALLGCTAFGGAGYDVHFVAGPTQGGAARCSVADLRSRVADAAAGADSVVVAIEAGPTGEPTTRPQRAAQRDYEALARAAAESGAALVVGTHSPVLQGVSSLGGVPWLRATGDLVDDTRAWATLPTALPRAVLADGAVGALSVDPLAKVRMRPVPTAGTLADATVRRIAADPAGLLTAGRGTAYWPALGTTERSTVTGDPQQVTALPAGARLDGGTPARVGTDLLWGTGSMEDLDTDPASTGSTLWALGRYVTTSMEAGCHDVQGLRLRRGPLSEKDVVISPQYRTAVHAGQQLTLLANVRLASAGASLEVRWYRSFDPDKRSSGQESVEIPPRRLADTCDPVRLDLTVPDGIVAAEPYVRLSPLNDVNLAAELRVDDVRLIAWSDPASTGAASAGDLLVDTVELGDSRSVEVVSDAVGGG